MAQNSGKFKDLYAAAERKENEDKEDKSSVATSAEGKEGYKVSDAEE